MLGLENNQLTTLPESFGQLRALGCLALHINQLTTLPASFGHLQALTELDINDNRLDEMPETLNQLVNLHRLNDVPISSTMTTATIFTLTRDEASEVAARHHGLLG